MKIILLRHTETISNKLNQADSQIDAELTNKGKKDARRLASKLKFFNIDVYIVSPLKRCLYTIQPYLDTLKEKPRIITSDLTIERNLGDFTGTTMGTFQKYCGENNYNKVFHRPKNGESIAETYKRATKFFNYFKKRFADETILICGHKNFLMCFEILIRNKNIKNYYKFKPLQVGEIRQFNL